MLCATISISGNADGTGSNIVSVMINDSRFTIFTDPSGTPSGAYEPKEFGHYGPRAEDFLRDVDIKSLPENLKPCVSRFG